MKKLKKIPKFKNEAEEFEFWSTNDSTEYIDWSKAEKAYFPNLQLSSRHISIRLPEILFEQLRNIAHKKDIPYQSLMKVFLDEKVKEELKLSLPHS